MTTDVKAIGGAVLWLIREGKLVGGCGETNGHCVFIWLAVGGCTSGNGVPKVCAVCCSNWSRFCIVGPVSDGKLPVSLARAVICCSRVSVVSRMSLTILSASSVYSCNVT